MLTHHSESVTTTNVHKSHPNYSAQFAIQAKAEPTGVGEDLILNPGYFKTAPGIIKIIQLVIAVVCMCCISPPLTWYARLFTFVVAISFALTVILCFSYLVTLRNVVFPTFNWTFAELIFTIIAAVSYLITSIIQISITARADYKISLEHYGYFGPYIAAGVFGLLNSIAYGIGSYFLAMRWKETRTSPNSIRPANNNRP